VTYEKHTPYSLSDWLAYLSHKEIDFLTELARSLPEKPDVINIGAGGGTSGLALLSARDDLRLTTIDPVKERNPVGGLENELGILESSGVSYVGRHTQIQGDSKKVGRSWDWGLIDMVFVDGDHTYEGCRGDIEEWMPHLRFGGVIALHDYQKIAAWKRMNPAIEVVTDDMVGHIIKPYPGVDKAVEELLESVYESLGVVNTLIAFRKNV